MQNIARVGIDLAKRVFHVTTVDGAGAVVERRKLRRAGLQSYLALLPRGCTVAMEACSSANHWCWFAHYLTADFQDCFERLKRRFLALFWHHRIEAHPSRTFFLNHVVRTGTDRFGRLVGICSGDQRQREPAV